MSAEYKWDLEHSQGYGNRMGRYLTSMEWNFILDSLDGSDLKILDIGGGSGRFAIPLADRGHSVTVADLSPTALALLRSRSREPIDTVAGDFLEFESSRQFDAVLAIESLLYFTDLELGELFSRIAEHLRPGGKFVFTILNRRSLRYLVRRTRDGTPDQFAVATKAEVLRCLRGSGFEADRVEGLMWIPLPVASNSPLVPVAATVERLARLNRLTTWSPWLLFAATRR